MDPARVCVDIFGLQVKDLRPHDAGPRPDRLWAQDREEEVPPQPGWHTSNNLWSVLYYACKALQWQINQAALRLWLRGHNQILSYWSRAAVWSEGILAGPHFLHNFTITFLRGRRKFRGELWIEVGLNLGLRLGLVCTKEWKMSEKSMESPHKDSDTNVCVCLCFQLSKSNCQYHKIFKEISKEEQLRQSKSLMITFLYSTLNTGREIRS